MSQKKKVVIPLDNDPEHIAKYSAKLGVDLSTVSFQEIFSLDEELLPFIPRPCYSVIFLYPINESLEARGKDTPVPDQNGPWFTLQTVSNQCGTIALIHSIMNNLQRIKINPGSWFDQFAKKTASMTPEQRAEDIYESDFLTEAHQEAASSSTVEIPEEVDLHFIAFVHANDKVWELDGRKPNPICHGPATDLVIDACNVIKKEFMPLITDPLKISLIGLCAPSD